MDEEFTAFRNETDLKIESSLFFPYQGATPGLCFLLCHHLTVSGEINGTPPLWLPQDNLRGKSQMQPEL